MRDLIGAPLVRSPGMWDVRAIFMDENDPIFSDCYSRFVVTPADFQREALDTAQNARYLEDCKWVRDSRLQDERFLSCVVFDVPRNRFTPAFYCRETRQFYEYQEHADDEVWPVDCVFWRFAK